MSSNVLTITQDILSDISGDEVNSIEDTVESSQVASIIVSTFNDLMANRDWPHTKKFVSVSTYSDVNYPSHLILPTNLKRLLFINYDKRLSGETRLKYEAIKYKEPEPFLRMVNQRDSDSSNIISVTDTSGVIFNIYCDRHPEYYTSFDEKILICDAFYQSIDDTLIPSKVQAYGYTTSTLIKSDTAIPDLPEKAFPGFIEECKSRCSLKLRQTADAKAEQESQRQRIYLSRNSWTVAGGIQIPNYGRRGLK